MYRYTATKNKKHHEQIKLKQKKLQTKQTVALKKTPLAKKKVRKQFNQIDKKKVKPINKKLPPKQKNQWPEWILKLFKFSLNIIAIIILCDLIVIILINIFLPQIFGLNEEKNILLVDAPINERATSLYLLHLSPQSQNTEIAILSGDLLVPISGGYGQYPLGSLAPLLEFETNNLTQIIGAYNFAFKKIIDEVYFLSEINDIKTNADLAQVFSTLIKNDLNKEAKINFDHVKLFFHIKSHRHLKLTHLQTLTDGLDEPIYTNWDQNKLIHCPIVLVNATEKAGLVKKVSQLVESNGLSVINWETWGEKKSQSVIYYDENEPECEEVIVMIKKIFPLIDDVVADQGAQAKKYRAKALIIFGNEVLD